MHPVSPPHLPPIHLVVHSGPTWLDYMTAFGTVISAVAAVAAAGVSLWIANKDRAAAAKVQEAQTASANALAAADRQAAASRAAVERRADLLLALTEQLGELHRGSETREYHVATGRIRAYVTALGDESFPLVKAVLAGPVNPDGALEEVAGAIRDLAEQRASVA